jgi:hypothetical protein
MKLIKIGNRKINESEVEELTIDNVIKAISIIILFCRWGGNFLFCRRGGRLGQWSWFATVGPYYFPWPLSFPKLIHLTR